MLREDCLSRTTQGVDRLLAPQLNYVRKQYGRSLQYQTRVTNAINCSPSSWSPFAVQLTG
jgi:hypothetical protein